MFNNSKLALISLSTIALILAAASSFGVYQVYSENRESSQLLTMADDIEKKETLAQSIRAMENSARADFDALDKIAITNENLVGVIETVEGTARALHLNAKIGSVDKVATDSEEGPQKVRISIDLSGSWASSFAFLRAVESLPYRVMFETVNLDKVEGVWESKIIFSLYLFD